MANPERQASPRAASRSRPSPRATSDEPGRPFATTRQPPVSQLAAEIDSLKAELAASRARIAELQALADIDPLLEILNRRGFERELRRSLAYAMRYGARAALIYFDLDHFKIINDTHGHAAGDRVLATVAATLTRNVRASDVVGRLGGDEFAVLLWSVLPEVAAAKAEALVRAVTAATTAWNGLWLTVGISAGVAMLEPQDEPADVIARADRAMYAGKARRR